MGISLARRLVAEFVGTGLLLAVIVGSGIMAERLAGGNVALALLANSIATGTGLVALILAFGPVSGAHLNPLVTVADAWLGRIGWGMAGWYSVAQVLGAMAGMMLANGMFGLALVTRSTHVRTGPAQWVSEAVATFGLFAVILGCVRSRPHAIPFAVGAYITAAYWFTSSTSFANPAVTLARAFTDTFTGIRLGDVGGFVVAQIVGAAAAVVLFRWLMPVVDIRGE